MFWSRPLNKSWRCRPKPMSETSAPYLTAAFLKQLTGVLAHLSSARKASPIVSPLQPRAASLMHWRCHRDRGIMLMILASAEDCKAGQPPMQLTWVIGRRCARTPWWATIWYGGSAGGRRSASPQVSSTLRLAWTVFQALPGTTVLQSTAGESCTGRCVRCQTAWRRQHKSACVSSLLRPLQIYTLECFGNL